MNEEQLLRLNPPSWVDETEDLPDATLDKRELWELVATCTPMACISAHYSSLTIRVIADWLEARAHRASVNGWNYTPVMAINDLRLAAVTADIAIKDGEIMPRKAGEL